MNESRTDRPQTIFADFGEPPQLDPVIRHETTDYGWRGLTLDGEILEVRSKNGHKATLPEGNIIVALNGKAIGQRKLTNDPSIDIDDYLLQFNRVVALYRENQIEAALQAANAAIAIAPTLRARFNRAMLLLAAGDWRTGFEQYEKCEDFAPFMRPQVRAALDAGMRPWRGENINGKRILLLHAHGFGDSIMCLRYVPMLEAMGAIVSLDLPRELDGLLDDYMPSGEPVDYFCPLLHLLGRLYVSPDACLSGPYLDVDPERVAEWRERLGSSSSSRKRIGIAWSIGKPSIGDYPREIDVEELLAHLDPEAEIYSVQAQLPRPSARTGRTRTFGFENFGDCAALMLCLDEIISVDTAAVHLAGAIGHPNVKLLLSHWHSWRWRKKWYENVTLCKQTSPGDWASALAQVSP